MNQSTKQYEVLKWASLFLEKRNREAKVAELLLQHYLDVSRAEFISLMRETVPTDTLEKFREAITKHAKTGIPVQHITGYEIFYDRKFHVNEHVLIPRPETEELVQHVITMVEQNFYNQPLTIADIGTGSGIIAATLALELENANVYATDISEKALSTAKNNAIQLGADVTFLQGDFLEALIHNDIKADIIVSNPPYIAWSDQATMSDTVKSFDPELALFADDNGLAAYRKIIAELPHVLTENAYVAFEIGYQQGDAVKALLKDEFPNAAVQVLQDINKKDRMVTVKLN